ncbi:hypothetical protein [Exiguobacterium alkaliphilum]|uniref:hypothetical protein n=1 Tax=Exiguobacterium alkaliphilum TaxID=1428684 RepID=UPI001BA80857|nr:hypothetical protein [Exiguobacterium alkaliphilum]QUE85428.1 hypothetical protein KB235_09620 [Exiguobacterium alkaliphilum]
MVHFLKLQSISILLAVLLLVNIQLLANSGRLYLIMGNIYMMVITASGLVSLVLFTRVIIKRVRQLATSTWNLSLYVLWIPYLALFTYVWTRVIPAPSEAAWPGPAVGLVIIALTFTFPLYVFIVHMIARSKQRTT